MVAFSSPDYFSSNPPPAGSEPQPRPGLALDYFFMRRRTATIGEQFWTVVAKGWTDFNSLERMRAARLFSRFRPYWTPEFFTDENRAFYDSLPEAFTAYRGQNGTEIAAGGVFTLSKAVARNYALGRRTVRHCDPTIVSLRVAKSDVALAFSGRDDEEIVLFPLQWNAARIEATHPGRLTH